VNTNGISPSKELVHVMFHNNCPLPAQHAAIFSRKTLSRYLAPPAADPSSWKPPQVVRQQTAVLSNGVPPITNISFCRVFLPAYLFTLCSRAGGQTTPRQCSKLTGKTSESYFEQDQHCVRVDGSTSHTTSGLINYQVIDLGSM
jgi:hypothetical protein